MIKFRKHFEFSSPNIEGPHHTKIIWYFNGKSIPSFLRKQRESGMSEKLEHLQNKTAVNWDTNTVRESEPYSKLFIIINLTTQQERSPRELSFRLSHFKHYIHRRGL